MKPGGFEVVCFALKTYLPGVPHPNFGLMLLFEGDVVTGA